MKKMIGSLVILAIVACVINSFAAPGVPSFANEKKVVTGNVTNGEAILLTAPVMVLNGVGGAADTTNTITITGTHYVDDYILITVSSASTNWIKIADDGSNLSLGSDVILGPTDTLLLRPISASKAVKVSTSDN